jgi:molybdopterin-binding protein
MPQNDDLLSPRAAARLLGVSYPTLKQWIYKGKIRTVKTAGGHHRIPSEETDKFLYRATPKGSVGHRQENLRRLSGRNQLIGRVTEIQVVGLMAQVKISIGGQLITSIVTREAVQDMHLQKGQTVAALIKSTGIMIVRP